MPKRKLDAIDRRILDQLQENARIPNVDLARRVGLSPSPCSRRVRELENDGVIQRYATLIDPGAAGLAGSPLPHRIVKQARRVAPKNRVPTG